MKLNELNFVRCYSADVDSESISSDAVESHGPIHPCLRWLAWGRRVCSRCSVEGRRLPTSQHVHYDNHCGHLFHKYSDGSFRSKFIHF